MNASLKTWFVIINPTAGNGSAKKKWPKIQCLLNSYKFDYDYAFTEYKRHSIKLIQQAVNRGVKNIISVGGDGTLHNIVNGIMTQNSVPSSAIKVGVIPVGTGNDWVKTYSIPKHIESAIKIIKNGNVVHQDLGKIEFINSNNLPVYFNNSAGVGFDGYVVSKVEKYKNIGVLAYLFGALMSTFYFKNFNSKIYINSKKISGNTLMISIGICKFSGGGMQLTSSPNSFDGLFDISIAKDFNSLDIIKNVLTLFNGKIETIKKVETIKTSLLEIEINQKNMPLIQADGELIGSGNIKISMLPKAFSFYTLKV